MIYVFLKENISKDNIINIIPIERRIVVVPKNGMRKYPARNVPNMLPAVEMAYKFPIVFPMSFFKSFISLLLSFAAYGEMIPRKKLVGANKNREENNEDISNLGMFMKMLGIISLSQKDIRIRIPDIMIILLKFS